MTDRTDGGPAFPRVGEGFGNPNYDAPGMTLRDYFAGQALAGVMAAAEEHFSGNSRDKDALADWKWAVESNWAGFCYRMADAMCAARVSPPTRIGEEV